MAEYTTLEQVKIRLKQFHIDSESSEVVFDELEDKQKTFRNLPYYRRGTQHNQGKRVPGNQVGH